MQVFIDIETVPSQQAGAREQVRATIRPPATLKKAESISAWIATEAAGAAEIAFRKQSLDGGTVGEIVSIAMVASDGREWVKCRQQNEFEASLLTAFGQQVVRWVDEDAKALTNGFNYAADPHFIAHNAAFDIGFLWRRAIVNGVRLPFALPSPSARPGKNFDCTMTMWAGFGQRIGLDPLCRALGVESPKAGGFDGSQVYDAWLAGQYAEIEQYNLAGARAVAAVWERMQHGMGGGAAWAG